MGASAAALAIGVGAAGSIAGGLLAKKGADTQARAAERAQAEAVAEQRRQFDINRSDLMPWLQSGSGAVQRLAYLLGIPVSTLTRAVSTGAPSMNGRGISEGRYRNGRYRDLELMADGEGVYSMPWEAGAGEPTSTAIVPAGQPDGDFGSLMRDFSTGDFQTDPGYEFRLREGAKALERSAAAKGTVLSGGTLKALTQYSQDFASNEFGNAYNRFQENRRTRYNQLAGLAGLGQQTAHTLAATGTATANNIANTIIGGQTAAAAARASGYNALGNTIANAANIPLNWMMLSRLSGGGGGFDALSAARNPANWAGG